MSWTLITRMNCNKWFETLSYFYLTWAILATTTTQKNAKRMMMAPCLKKMTTGKINQRKEGTHKTFFILGLLVTTIKKTWCYSNEKPQRLWLAKNC